MINICTSYDEMDNTIVKVLLSDGTNQYKVIYASGREEIFDFSVHNYNVEIYRMMNQYNNLRDKYVNYVNILKYKNTKKVLIDYILSLIGITFVANLSLETPLKILFSLLVLVVTFISHKSNRKISYQCNNSYFNIEIADKIVEKFKDSTINVTDPNTGREEPWHLITLNEMESYFGPELVSDFADMIDDESIPTYREEIEQTLKKVAGR